VICYPTPETPLSSRKRMTLRMLQDMQLRGEPIAMLTVYDAVFAQLLDDAGADCLLVSDSLGMRVQGHGSTLPVTLEQMVYHTGCVARGNRNAWIIADLPWTNLIENTVQVLRSSAALIQAGAQMVKLTGGGVTTEVVAALTKKGIPVCAHLGLTARSVHALGVARPQVIDENAAATLMVRAMELADAGASMLVLEQVPAALTAKIRQALPQLLTIGIDAGPHAGGQWLDMHDVLGVSRAKLPRGVREFMRHSGTIDGAVRGFIAAVKEGVFPDDGRPARPARAVAKPRRAETAPSC
jgi:3-methyl-2-oxobutanoate hydroxymethyltransferase